MRSGPDTQTRIINAAITAVSRRGRRKLSMHDIGEAAGVSRGTLYRYFKNKDEVLHAVGRHIYDGVRKAMDQAIEANPDPRERVQVIVAVLVEAHRTYPEAERLVGIEPAFSLVFIRQSFASFLELVTAALEPVIDEIPVARAGGIDARQLADLIMRVVTSTYFIPREYTQRIPQWADLLAGVDVAAGAATRR